MASANAAADMHRGQRVGKYEILTRLSVGGMAELFLAFLPGPGGFRKFVALKQILPDVKADEAFVKMFLDEARITAAFNHGNIGAVFDLGEDSKSKELYLAMEFIAGQNLEQTIKRAAKREVAIPIGFAARVIRDTCLALHYAHHFVEPSTGQPMPVVHRDVSPKNVMITYRGDVKVIDFGIAKARGRLGRTQVGIVKGTSGYMSPEQVRNETLDGRSDLFATAVMLYELLAGERLFTAPTDAAMMLKIVDGDIAPIAGVNPAVSQQLNDVVMKGLAKKKEHRFSTGKELARALEQACPELFEEEQCAELMNQLFEDKVAITRALFDLANKADADESNVAKAVEELRKDEAESGGTPRPRKAAAKSATPAPRQGLATPKAGMSSRSLPKVGEGARRGQSAQNLPKAASSSPSNPKVGGSVQGLNKVSSGPKSQQRLPKVGSDPRRVQGPPGEDEVTGKSTRQRDDGDATIPPRSRAGPMPAMPRQAGPSTDPYSRQEPAPKKGGGLGLLIGAAVVLVLLAGGGWAVTMGPLKDSAKELAQAHEEKPVDTGPKPIDVADPTGDVNTPKWLKEKQEADALAAAERERQRQIEEAASDPERVKLIEEIDARLKDLNRLEEEQRQLKLEAKAGKAVGDANTKKIESLEKQIEEMKTLIKERQERASSRGPRKNADGVEIVKDSRSAREASMGYVTLRTVNPSSAAVFQGGSSLGSTPLVKVPLDVGTHKLRVIDGDSKSRLLSVTVEAGKTLELKGVDVGSLPMMP